MEIIGCILNLSYDIYLIYLELFGLDICGNKGNSRYLSLVKSLKHKIREEKDLYKVLSQDRDSFNMLLNYVRNNSTDLFFLRMYSYMLFNEVDMDYEFRRLYYVCNRDLFLVYLSLLQDYVDDETYTSIRDGLIYTKYYNSFINLDLEEYMIENNFEISKINYEQSGFALGVLLLDEKVLKEKMQQCCLDAVAVSVAGILIIKDDDFDNEDRMVDIISSQCMLQASLSMFSNQEYQLLKDCIYGILNELSNSENNKSVRIVNSILDSMTEDKIRTRRIFINYLF